MLTFVTATNGLNTYYPVQIFFSAWKFTLLFCETVNETCSLVDIFNSHHVTVHATHRLLTGAEVISRGIAFCLIVITCGISKYTFHLPKRANARKHIKHFSVAVLLFSFCFFVKTNHNFIMKSVILSLHCIQRHFSYVIYMLR